MTGSRTERKDRERDDPHVLHEFFCGARLFSFRASFDIGRRAQYGIEDVGDLTLFC